MVTIFGKERQISKTVFNISLSHLLFVAPQQSARHSAFHFLGQFSVELANRSRPLSAGFRAVTLRIICPNVLPLPGLGAVFRKRAGKDAAGRNLTGTASAGDQPSIPLFH